MALRESFMIAVAIGNTDLELKAEAGKSLLVKDIMIYNPASNYITCTIEKTTVGYFRVGGALGSHLPWLIGRAGLPPDWKTSPTAVGDQTSFAGLVNAGGVEVAAKMIGGLAANTLYERVGQVQKVPNTYMKTILGLLAERGIFKGYPVAEGQTFRIKGAAKSGAVQLVIYEEYDAEDIKSDMQNGTTSKEYFYINYITADSAINKTGDTWLKVSNSPAEFPNFPAPDPVPPKKEITIHAVLASDFAPAANDGTNYCYTKYLKFIKDRDVLFDKDRNGLLYYAPFTKSKGNMDMVAEGLSLGGNYTDVDMRMPLFFPKPLVFSPGEELGIYWTTEKGGTGAEISTDKCEVGLITTVKTLE